MELMSTKIMPIRDLSRHTNKIVQSVRENGDVVFVTQGGRPAAVLLDYEVYEALLAQLEDLSDLASLKAALDEPERAYEAFLAELEIPASSS
jgi:prevent-host-death family protein